MLNSRKFWFRVALALFVVGVAFLFLPPYKQYCENDHHNQYACASYEITALFASFAETYNGAITAIATVVVAGFTGTIYAININQLSHGRQVERAYVSGSAIVDYIQTPGTYGGVTQGPPHWLSIVVSNNGKTPAYVKEIALSVCSEDELPKPMELEGDYKRSTLLVDRWVSPGAKDERTNLGFDFKVASGKIVYGRVYYVDIFENTHSSGFILRVLSGGVGAYEAPPEYISWN